MCRSRIALRIASRSGGSVFVPARTASVVGSWTSPRNALSPLSATSACPSPSFTSCAARSPLKPGRSCSSLGSTAELSGPVYSRAICQPNANDVVTADVTADALVALETCASPATKLRLRLTAGAYRVFIAAARDAAHIAAHGMSWATSMPISGRAL